MNIKQINIICSIGLFFLLIQPCFSKKIRKKAIVFCSGNYKNQEILQKRLDKGTKNCLFISVAHVNHSLVKMGYKTDVFYDNGKYDDKEPLIQNKIKGLKIKKAIRSNFEKYLISCKDLGEDDELIIYLSNHGEFDNRLKAYYKFGIEKNNLYPAELGKMLKDIKAKVLLVLDFCYSGQFKQIAKGNIGVLAASDDLSPAIRSRTCEFGRFFFMEFCRKKNDLNMDGSISIDEAFDVAERKRKVWLDYYLKNGDFGFYKIDGFKGRKFNTSGFVYKICNINQADDVMKMIQCVENEIREN